MATSHVADRELVGQLFKLNYDWLRARVRARLGCPHDADDIAAETFARVLALPDPSAVREPRALLTTIAQHLIYGCPQNSEKNRTLSRAMCLRASALKRMVPRTSEKRAKAQRHRRP